MIDAGLCDRCEHARRIVSTRGSSFVQCGLHATDPRFAKYPRLPVVDCPGYRERAQDGRPRRH
ncbi:MAG TPA: hypothetical protein VE987_14485 [Polyangiaceae bacterium]|nr:hypothetical protein [Polyangiaceae bacterium]